jgi:Kef-type K+ transport system membrane component KefB
LNAGGALLETLYRSGYPLIWQLVGSAALGYLVGLLLATWATKVVEHGEIVILLIGCVLLCVGVAAVLELSPLIASLAFGATMANLSAHSRNLLRALSQTDPPFYAIFFVIAGADLNLALLPAMGALGVAYLVGRGAGKLLGARIGAGMARIKQPVRDLLGFGILAHAGLAVGLSLAINRRFPEHAPAVVTVVLAVVIVYEVIGPVAARQAILRSGEARAEAPEPAAVGNLLS